MVNFSAYDEMWDGVDKEAVTMMYADMNEYYMLEKQFCHCEDLCTCGWDDHIAEYFDATSRSDDSYSPPDK